MINAFGLAFDRSWSISSGSTGPWSPTSTAPRSPSTDSRATSSSFRRTSSRSASSAAKPISWSRSTRGSPSKRPSSAVARPQETPERTASNCRAGHSLGLPVGRARGAALCLPAASRGGVRLYHLDMVRPAAVALVLSQSQRWPALRRPRGSRRHRFPPRSEVGAALAGARSSSSEASRTGRRRLVQSRRLLADDEPLAPGAGPTRYDLTIRRRPGTAGACTSPVGTEATASRSHSSRAGERALVGASRHAGETRRRGRRVRERQALRRRRRCAHRWPPARDEGPPVRPAVVAGRGFPGRRPASTSA